LPAAVRAAVGERKRQALHLDLLIDSRGRERIAGAPNRGFWGRLKAEVVHDDVEIFTRATFDLRGYRSLAGGAVAARARVSWVDSPAPFYDRLYLGGLYTVRGFPTHSLSSPGGDTWLWTGTLEYRAPLIGSGERTRLAGGLFADVGASGSAADAVFRTPSASLGWGLRLRLGFVGWIGLDVGYPVTRGPYDEAFHVNATIGWSF
jgi:outer membrane protein assembly factor BamA